MKKKLLLSLECSKLVIFRKNRNKIGPQNRNKIVLTTQNRNKIGLTTRTTVKLETNRIEYFRFTGRQVAHSDQTHGQTWSDTSE